MSVVNIATIVHFSELLANLFEFANLGILILCFTCCESTINDLQTRLAISLKRKNRPPCIILCTATGATEEANI